MKPGKLWWYGLIGLILAMPLQAAPVDDMRIVIDVSGSMVKTDPNNLRAPALRMLTGLIPAGSSAGVWMFGRYVNMEVKWGTVDQNWRKLADEGAAKIHSRGQFTNIEGAISRATSGWNKPDPEVRRHLVLLTDGQVDISKDPARNAASRTTILDQSLPGLIENGVKVHSIALSAFTDESLLKKLALQTGGSFEIAESADDLQRIFLNMFERAIQPDTVELQDNQFKVDDSIREMTLLVFNQGTRATILIPPDGQQQTEQQHASNISWRHDQGYDLITVSKPVSGVWKLDAEVDPNNRVMVVTDLKLVVDDLPPYSTPDQALNIQVELHDQGKKISKNSFLKFVDFKLSHRIGENAEILPLELKKSREISDKGIYLQQLAAPLVEGKHEVIISADARTFSRSKRYTVDVLWPVEISTQPLATAGHFRVSITPRDEFIKAETLKIDASLRLPDGQQQRVDVEAIGNLWQGEVRADQQSGPHQLMIQVDGQSPTGETISQPITPIILDGVQQASVATQESASLVEQTSDAETDAATEPAVITTEEPPETEKDWLPTILIILGVNLVWIIAAVAGFIYYRKRKQSNAVDLLDGELEDKSDD